MASITYASRSDRETVFGFMREFYAGERLQFTAEVMGGVDQILDDDGLGVICLIRSETETAGYFVVTWGYSLERGGRTALLDELFILPRARGQGLGKAAIESAAELARAAGCRALHLEVDQKNEAGQRLYRAAGFIRLDRQYLVRSLI